MTTIEAQLIGGPYDGDLIQLPELRHEWYVPVPNLPTLDDQDPHAPALPCITVAVYTRNTTQRMIKVTYDGVTDVHIYTYAGQQP